MASYNKVILIGNLTRDPLLKTTPSGSVVGELGLAVRRKWYDKSSQQQKEETTFVDVTLWGKTAEIASKYAEKGRAVMIDGRLQMDQWTDKETGQNRVKLKVVCENLVLLGSRNRDEGRDEPDRPANETAVDEVPF